MPKKDPMLAYTFNVVNLSDFDNSKISRAILSRTERDYKKTLEIFDKFVPSPLSNPTD